MNTNSSNFGKMSDDGHLKEDLIEMRPNRAPKMHFECKNL